MSGPKTHEFARNFLFAASLSVMGTFPFERCNANSDWLDLCLHKVIKTKPLLPEQTE